MSLEFVTFHSDPPLGVEGAHPNANLHGAAYLRMIDMLFRSGRLFHRRATATLLTDTNTKIEGIGAAFRRVNCAIDHASLMLSRSLAQLAYINEHDFSRPLVLIDSDVLVNGSLESLFREDFDVALTWREHKSAPINGGLLILNNRHPEVVRAFLRRVVTIYQEKHAHRGRWFGDQLALRDVIGLSSRAVSRSQLLSVDGCRVLMLPCETYNFSPSCSLSAIVAPLEDKFILHFKGPRKILMERYWRTYLQPRELMWPFSQVAGIRARNELHALIRQQGDAERSTG